MLVVYQILRNLHVYIVFNVLDLTNVNVFSLPSIYLADKYLMISGNMTAQPESGYMARLLVF